MCGIAGRVNFNGENLDSEILLNAINQIESRGPDSSGTWIERGCSLVHRRLAIIDLTESGSQPMTSADGRYVCVFNGEIYNYRAIKNSLGSSARWKGNSDTEVLVEAWSKWGFKVLDMLDGMFAFTIWDKHLRKLYAARDRFGEKPFYYNWDGKSFTFASRPTPIFTLKSDISKDYDEQSLRYFLESGYVPAPYSIHREIKKLEPSKYLEVDETGLKIESYWNPLSIEPNSDWKHRKEDDLLDELDAIISNSVKERMVSDVPLGAFLSGGIDSSLIVAMMAKHSSQKIKTFTIGFKEKAYDESSEAKLVADHIGTDHFSEMLNVDDLLDLMPNFLKNYDEPFFDSSAFPTMAVSRLARKHVTVSLTGDGGDELFGGYHYYKIAKILNPFFSLPSWLRSSVGSAVGSIPLHKTKLLGAALKQKNSARSFAFSRSIAKDFHNILHKDVLSRTSSMLDLFEEKAGTFPKGLHASEQGMRLDASYTLNDDYLQKTDVASMAFSLESRSPLLSRSVIEWGMRLPVNWKVRGLGNKYLLRKLLYRYVPRELVDRPKRGFGVPVDSWLRNQLSPWASERLDNPDLFKNLPLEQAAVKDLFELHKTGKRNVQPLLWAVLMLLEFNNPK
jgi:asparagine synthase (glutamine-hydrolysing)